MLVPGYFNDLMPLILRVAHMSSQARGRDDVEVRAIESKMQAQSVVEGYAKSASKRKVPGRVRTFAIVLLCLSTSGPLSLMQIPLSPTDRRLL